MDRIKSPASPGERGQLVTADPPAAATQTELDTANKHLPLLRFSMQEREILEILGLSRFYRPTGRTSWSGYMQSTAYELGDGHYLSLWFGYQGDRPSRDRSQYGLKRVGLCDVHIARYDSVTSSNHIALLSFIRDSDIERYSDNE
jgi:hypothetical protein